MTCWSCQQLWWQKRHLRFLLPLNMIISHTAFLYCLSVSGSPPCSPSSCAYANAGLIIMLMQLLITMLMSLYLSVKVVAAYRDLSFPLPFLLLNPFMCPIFKFIFKIQYNLLSFYITVLLLSLLHCFISCSPVLCSLIDWLKSVLTACILGTVQYSSKHTIVKGMQTRERLSSCLHQGPPFPIHHII